MLSEAGICFQNPLFFMNRIAIDNSDLVKEKLINLKLKETVQRDSQTKI